MTEETIMETLKVQPLSEEERKSRGILKRLMGPIASCKEGTRNGRRYNRELWENALNDDIFKEKIDTKSLFLELGHPDREETHMDCACACIPEMPKIIDGDLYAVVDVLDTPAGKILNTLIDYGFKPGISSRGSGDVIEGFGGESEVDPETFFLETWDIVQTPALKKARLSVMESLDEGKGKLKKVLDEEINSSNEDDRKIMVEALKNVGIDLVEDVKSTSEATSVVEDVDIKNNNVTKDADAPVSVVTVSQSEDAQQMGNTLAVDNGNDELIEGLQNALKEKAELESTVRELQEKLAVSDAKAVKLEEEFGKCKTTVVRLTKLVRESDAKSKKVDELTEELNRKNEGIKLLNKMVSENNEKTSSEKKSLSESIKANESEISSLKRELRESKDESDKRIKLLEESLRREREKSRKNVDESKTKFERVSKLAEGYRKLANDVMDRYISSKAVMLGVKSDEIKRRLGESYSLDEVDEVCEELKSYSLNLSKLPFKLGKKPVVAIKESKSPDMVAKSSQFDDDVDEHSMRIAGLI